MVTLEADLLVGNAATIKQDSAVAAIDQARYMVDVERAINEVTASLFQTIVKNEIGDAVTLATQMLGDSVAAAEVVQLAFDKARSEFDSYDGGDSPRAWVLSYVAAEAIRRSA